MIRLMTNKEFEEKYEHWCVTNEMSHFIYLPRETFIVIEENGKFTAIDNRTLDAWTEEFDSLDDAVKYCLSIDEGE